MSKAKITGQTVNPRGAMLHFLTEFLKRYFSEVFLVVLFTFNPKLLCLYKPKKPYLLINKKLSRKKLVGVAKILAM